MKHYEKICHEVFRMDDQYLTSVSGSIEFLFLYYFKITFLLMLSGKKRPSENQPGALLRKSKFSFQFISRGQFKLLLEFVLETVAKKIKLVGMCYLQTHSHKHDK